MSPNQEVYEITPASSSPAASASPPCDLPYLLVNPPLTDPTEPYHSLPYLVGAARERGFVGDRCLDANVDALNHLARPEQVAGLLERAAEVRKRVEASGRRTRDDEIRYRIALTGVGLTPGFASEAVDVFRNEESFFHYPTYRRAVLAMRRWQTLLSLDGMPWSFSDFQLRRDSMVNLASFRDLCDEETIGLLTRPFDSYFEGPYSEALRSRPWKLIGFSVNYTSQLPFALRMAALARALCPGALIVFGGTEVCDAVRFTREPGGYWRLFADADVIVPGEGESPFGEILAAVRDARPVDGIRGTLIRGEATRTPVLNYENLRTLPTPAYDVWDWDSYWSPEPVVLYSPTRGCYWNKCTFCDYGLNDDHPTSPSRDRPVEAVIQDLREISKIGRMVYFAVDAMSPRYLRALSEAIAGSALPTRWSAELRLERTFPKSGMADLLARAGCLAVSFGYESGSQRVLDLIDKGTRLAEIPTILETLAAQGIGVQMMGFTGFPSETQEEAEQTFRFLSDHFGLWALAGLGSFGLTRGSMVAKDPARFGVELLPPPHGEDIARDLPWRDQRLGVDHPAGEPGGAEVPAWARSLRKVVDDRPFVGGIDTAHTMLYFDRYGRMLLPDAEVRGGTEDDITECDRHGIPFETLKDFTTLGEVRREFARLQQGPGAHFKALTTWLSEPGRSMPGASEALILPSGSLVSLPRGTNAATVRAVVGKARSRGEA